ncbi:response regulator [Moorena sp. SIO3I8]|uniref:response regulator n=1 Tax=Moorena sp. SIO3I8 TaxID=2607833 RepID=UPI0013BEFE73|nr:response regulator [Moorena sp. SIO3I8]NEO10243.1 response regulator [Moorena sp. SIO3I8]
MRLLLVEDDNALALTLSKVLREQNYIVNIAGDGEEGWEYAQAFTYDLIVLEVDLPKLDGISLCKRLRQASYDRGILLLLSQSAIAEQVKLNAEADDYIVKPFTAKDLLTRIRTLLRHHSVSGLRLLEWGDVCLDPSTCEVTYKGQLLHLSPKEYGLLELFLSHPRRVFSQSFILGHLWSFEDPPSPETVRAHVKGLRRKLKSVEADDMIETVYGMGYRLKSLPRSKRKKIKPTPTRFNQPWELSKGTMWRQFATVEQAVNALEAGHLTEELRKQAQQQVHKLVRALDKFGLVEGSRLAQTIEYWLQFVSITKTRNSGKLRYRSRRRNYDNQIELPSPQLQQLTSPTNIQNLASLVALLSEELQQPPSAFSGDVISELEDNPTITVLKESELTKDGRSEPLAPEQFPKKLPLILVIDGEVQLTQQLEREAVNWDMQVKVVLDPREARFVMDQEVPDVVLLELMFPNDPEVGMALLKYFQNQYPQIPVIVSTQQNRFSDRVEVARQGGRAFLSKPVTPIQLLETVEDVLNQARPSTAKVLAVDDDPLVLESIRHFLQPLGVQITTLEEPDQFWEQLEATGPDLLILDLDMPQFNGIELCQVVRIDRIWHGLPILLLCEHQDSETIHRIYEAGADDYIFKPITKSELVTRVFHRLERTKLLRSLGETDQLTGVANRRQSTIEFNRLLRLSQRYHQPLCYALLDLNNLKQVNEQYGHVMGDRMLKRLGQILRQKFRSEDIVARWGGKEFFIGMYGLNRQAGVRRLQEILETVSEEFDNCELVQVTFSAGVAEYPEDGTDIESLYRAADEAIERGKATGQDCVFPAQSLVGNISQ